MPHDLGMPLFIFGAVLMLIGLVGGSFSIFGAQVSGRAGGVARFIALVLGAALIVLSLTILAPGLLPIQPFSNPKPNQTGDIAGRYNLDPGIPRVIEVTRIGDVNFKIGEFSGPWPWEGTVILNGNSLEGEARFASGTRLHVSGMVQPDRAIRVSYIYISDDTGNPMNRRDDHVWVPIP